MFSQTAKNSKKTFTCPNCNKHVTIQGKPGQKLFVTCPDCGSKGFVSFPKTSEKKQTEQKHKSARLKSTDEEEQHQKHKPYFLGATKKQLVGYSITGILGVLFIFGVVPFYQY